MNLYLFLLRGLMSLSLLFGCYLAHAQLPSVDSLQTLLSETKADSSRARILVDLAHQMVRTDWSRSEEASRYMKEAEGILAGYDYLPTHSIFFLVKGKIERRAYRPQIGKSYLRKGLFLAREHQDEVREGILASELANLYYRNLQAFDSAAFWFRQALALDLARGDSLNIGRDYGDLANLMADTDSLDQSEIYHRLCLAYLPASATHERANSFSNLGIYFYQKGQMDSTARYFIQARRMWEAAGESYYGAVVGMNLSVIFIQLKDFPKAYQYLHLAIPVFDSLGNQSSLAMAYNNLASVVKESGAVDSIRKSTRIHLKALRIREAIGDSAGIATSLNNIGGNYADLKESAQAIPYLKQALAIKRSLGISQGEAQALYNLGLAYQEEGSLSKSRNYFGQSLSRARKLGSPEDMRLAYLGLAESAAAQGRYEEAYTYRLSYETIQDSLVSAEKAAEIQRLNVEYETEKNERLLQEEKQKAEIATLSVSRQRTQIGFLVSALLLGGGLAFLLFQQNRLQHRYRLNEQLIQQQKERLDAVLETQELERERIARDLHDGIGQLLTATRMQVNALGDPVILQKDTAHILPMLDEAIGEVRAISHTMMPLSLEEYGLGVALEEMLNKSLGKGELVYTFEVLGKEVRMEKKAELAVYRIAQELIGNVLKHAGASQVMVQLLFRSGTLSLRVEDNGQGIQEEGSGMGLRNIHDRLKALQGSFSTETNAQEGTTAVINIPL